MGMEEHVIILDYLANGRPEDDRPIYKREPLAYGVGDTHMTLMELIPKKGVELSAHDHAYIGKGDRDNIDYVKRRVTYNDLSSAAKSELPYVIEELVEKNSEKYIDFINNSSAVSTRLHGLELLPGIGKKLMWEILDERKKEPFKSFEDISERIKVLPNPKKLFVKRILSELEGDTKLGKGKYKLFTIPFQKRK